MEIQRCFEILELNNNATSDDAKQSYKDLVNIWHPDRFSGNSRLKQKAEDKLKEINVAYGVVTPFLSSKKATVPQTTPEAKAEDEAKTGIKTYPSHEARFHKPEAGTGPKNKTEAFVETGTGIILGLFSSLYANFRRIVADVKTEIDQGNAAPLRRNDNNKGKGGRGSAGRGTGRAMGRGRGMGKRGGNRGRGRN